MTARIRRDTAVGVDALAAVAKQVDSAVRPVFDVLRDIEATLREIHTSAGQFGVESLARVRLVAQRTLMSNTGWIAGTGYVSAVDVLADMPRWLEWWIAGPNGPEPLRVDLDPRLGCLALQKAEPAGLVAAQIVIDYPPGGQAERKVAARLLSQSPG